MSTESRLNGVPGETVNVEFLLTNFGADTNFVVSANERMFGDGLDFNTGSFLSAVSEAKPFVRRGETRSVTVELRIPASTPIGTKKMITLDIEPYGSTTPVDISSYARKFVFTVDRNVPQTEDRQRPSCDLTTTASEESCPNPGSDNYQQRCQQVRWSGEFILKVTNTL